MGKVPIWAQWSIIGAGVLLCPSLMLLLAGAVGWLWIHKLWARPRGSARVEPRVRAL
jgi:hypothetical protein